MATLLPRLAARALVLWVLTRCMLAVAMAMADVPPFATGADAAIYMTLLLAGIAAADIARRRERAWLDNLGVGRLRVVATIAAIGLLAELVLAAALSRA